MFPKIFDFINTKFATEEEKKNRVDQIKSGIKAGYDKLIEMAEPILLSGPVSFLILCNAEHGPSFCCALISIITKYDHLPLDWRKYSQESDESEPSMDVTRWYNILIQDTDETVHWYHQLFLNSFSGKLGGFGLRGINMRNLYEESSC